MPYERIIDPVTHDYVPNGKGGYLKTRTASTAVYHQILDELDRWWGDSEAGSKLYLLARENAGEANLRKAAEYMKAALDPFVKAGRIAELEINVKRDARNRFVLEGGYRDVQSGEQIDLGSVLPFGV